jgi:hypothetical protein
VTGPTAEPAGSSDGSRLPDGDLTDGDARLAEGLRQAHRRLAGSHADEAVKARAVERLVAISDAAKHDTTRAARRLERFLADLDDTRPGPGGSPGPEA